MSTDLKVRKLNLVDLLLEENDDVEEPPEYAIDLWSEEHIRQYFENGGLLRGLPVPTDDFTPSPASAGDKNQNGVHLKDEVRSRMRRYGCPSDNTKSRK
jgi:hypothetical protein